jgi:hypothetical protein
VGQRLIERGWAVRGTTRDPGHLPGIEAAGIEPVVADPDRIGTLVDEIGDVALVYWLLGSATGEPEALAALHGPRLARMLEEIVDTPVRGFVYEAKGRVQTGHRERGASLVQAAAERWRIPVEIVGTDPSDPASWTKAMLAAADRLVVSR